MAARRLLPGPRSVEGRFTASRRFDGLVPSSRAVPGARGFATSPIPRLFSFSHFPRSSLLSPYPLSLCSQRLLVHPAALDPDLAPGRGRSSPLGRERVRLALLRSGPASRPSPRGGESRLHPAISFDLSTSTRVRRPPEFKHITKGRKRK